MKRTLFGLTFLLACAVAQAQTPVVAPPSLINFQGRLAKPDGTPLPDTASQQISLSLWDTATVGSGTMRWQQTFTNVNVHNGVFAVLLNLSNGFVPGYNLDSTLNNAAYLQVQVGTDAPLTPRQQIVSAAYALKAGTVPDGSITPVKLAAGTLSLLSGGAAGGDLTGAFPNPLIKTDSGLLNKVSGTLLNVAQNITTVDVKQLTQDALVTNSAWQTFIPSKTGTLLEIDVYSGTTGASIPTTLSIYAGQGTGSAPLLTAPVTVNSALGLQSFPLTLSVTGGQVYTWAIGSNNNLLFGYTGGNALPGGVSDLGTNFDYDFQTLMKSATGPTTQINAFANLNMTGANSIFLASGLLGFANTTGDKIELYGSGGGNNYGFGIQGGLLQIHSDGSGSDIGFGSGSSTAMTETMRIKGNGNVGIGTSSPDQLLTVNGKVHIVGAGNGIRFPDDTVQTTAPVFQGALAGGDLMGAYPNPALATLATSLNKVSGGAMTSSNGYIGINNASPAHQLDVVGTGYFNGGSGDGIDGYSSSGIGVYAYSDSNDGVAGISNTGPGVYGHSAGNTGIAGDSNTGFGASGVSSSNIGVYGQSNSSDGIHGSSSTGAGVYGYSASNTGVYGTSPNGTGVQGISTGSIGVYGTSSSNSGVSGYSASQFGVYGYSPGNTGGYFSSATGTGLQGVSTNGTGVYGYSSTGYAGYFNGSVRVTGPVSISGSASYVVDYGYLNPNGKTGTIKANGTPTNFSLYAYDRIACPEFDAFSDARIKRIKGRSDAEHDLNMLLGLEITDYTMRDTVAQGNKPYKKVIAQQVEKVYPQAVSKTTGVIPDIYQKATVQKGWVRIATNLKVGERVKVITEGKEAVYDVLEANAQGFRVAGLPDAARAFVYGREVKDFRVVDYDAIAMLNVSATQAIYRQVTQTQSDNAALRHQNEIMEARMQKMEKTLALLADPAQRVAVRQAKNLPARHKSIARH